MPSETWINPESRELTLAEMQNNAEIVASIMGKEGWTMNAIAAMLGNMQLESSINPGRWENDAVGVGPGFGLVQWTPASNVRNWIRSYYDSTDYTNGYYQLGRILYELDNGLQWYATSSYPLSFRQFTQSERDVEWLAMAFCYNYERGTPAETYRKRNAKYWWEYFGGKPFRKRLPVWLLFKLTERSVMPHG